MLTYVSEINSVDEAELSRPSSNTCVCKNSSATVQVSVHFQSPTPHPALYLVQVGDAASAWIMRINMDMMRIF